MIVRIMGEGQFEVDDSHLAELNELDDALGAAVEARDDAVLRTTLTTLLDAVRRLGTPVSDDTLVDSKLVLPYAEAHLDEVREMLQGEGLIPG